jgi:pimeloyl-ACP methyl ester carboxylesterase
VRRIVRYAVPGIAFTVAIAWSATAQTGTSHTATRTSTPQAHEAAAVNEAVYLIHGVQWDGATDCESSWKDAKALLRRRGFTGPLNTWGYYRGDRHCTFSYKGSLNTPVTELGRRLAWDIYNRYSRHGKSVSVLGHSMGGLVAAAALAGVQKNHGKKAWPPYLRVRNAVTLSTPFKGVTCVYAQAQCRDIKAGSPFLHWLATAQNPQGRGGTDWTLIGAYDDRRVSVRSGLGTKAKHKVAYLAGQQITHYNIHHLVAGAHWRFRYSNAWGKKLRQTAKGGAPLVAAAAALSSPTR